jgi:hypothetical protein
MTYSTISDHPSSTLISLIEHFNVYGIEITSSNVANGVLTVTTDTELSSELVEHLDLTVT